MKGNEMALVIDTRLKRFIKGTIFENPDGCDTVSMYVTDLDFSFQFDDKVKAQDFLNKQSTVRFYSDGKKDNFFDYEEVLPAGKEVHRYYIDKLYRGKIVSFREECFTA